MSKVKNILLLFLLLSNILSYSQDSIAWMEDGFVSKFIDFSKLRDIRKFSIIENCKKSSFSPSLTFEINENGKIIKRLCEYPTWDTHNANLKFTEIYERNDSNCLITKTYNNKEESFCEIYKYECKPDTIIRYHTSYVSDSINSITDTLSFYFDKGLLIKTSYQKGTPKIIYLDDYNKSGFYYSNNNKLIMRISIYNDTTRYEYDKKGVLIKEIYVMNNNKYIKLTKYDYSNDYKNLNVFNYKSNSKLKPKRLLYSEIVEFNSHGLPIKENYYNYRHFLIFRIKKICSEKTFNYTYI